MRRRVLLVQPTLQPPGGGNGVAAWMLEALAPLHDVTTLTWHPIDVAPIDAFFGTTLRGATFRALQIPRALRTSIDHLPVPAALLRSSAMMRYVRRVAPDFDVVIGANNEIDYGCRGIQYVHYPTYLRPRPDVDMRWYHLRPLLPAYYAAADRIAGFSPERMRANVTLANSNWTADRLRSSLGVEARTLYPPIVRSASSRLPWAERRSGFVALGRIAPEKALERAVDILSAVRRHHPQLTLTIVGTVDRSCQPYFDQLTRHIASSNASSWVTIRLNLSRRDVDELLQTHRYGIHAMRDEHFGMAPAEMAGAGMIVWVPDGGGQVEIVGEAPLLRYGTDEEAVQRILEVMNRDDLQARTREQLAARAELFSADRFVDELRRIVKLFDSDEMATR